MPLPILLFLNTSSKKITLILIKEVGSPVDDATLCLGQSLSYVEASYFNFFEIEF